MSEVKAFVATTVADANNKSDEEMEDVIQELWATGVKTTCPMKMVTLSDGRPNVSGECETAFLPYDL